MAMCAVPTHCVAVFPKQKIAQVRILTAVAAYYMI